MKVDGKGGVLKKGWRSRHNQRLKFLMTASNGGSTARRWSRTAPIQGSQPNVDQSQATLYFAKEYGHTHIYNIYLYITKILLSHLSKKIAKLNYTLLQLHFSKIIIASRPLICSGFKIKYSCVSIN